VTLVEHFTRSLSLSLCLVKHWLLLLLLRCLLQTFRCRASFSGPTRTHSCLRTSFASFLSEHCFLIKSLSPLLPNKVSLSPPTPLFLNKVNKRLGVIPVQTRLSVTRTQKKPYAVLLILVMEHMYHRPPAAKPQSALQSALGAL
jgi:hypothetical protein